MDKTKYTWDFFIAHAGADLGEAESLYSLLEPHCRVFLDSICLLAGDNWEDELPEAQRKSLVTIVLVSAHTEKAYYQQEEIAGAIAMARTDKDQHRVVPVFLDDMTESDKIPYGLRLKHGLRVVKEGGMFNVSKNLLELLHILEQQKTGGNLEDTLSSNVQQRPGTQVAFNNYSTGANNIASPPGTYPQPGTYPNQQRGLNPYPPYNQQPSYPPPPVFVLKCLFANDPLAYFVTNTNLIVAVNPFGQVMPVGQRIPSMNPHFAWMYQTPLSTYGVTFQGCILNTFLNGQTMQIGYVVRAGV